MSIIDDALQIQGWMDRAELTWLASQAAQAQRVLEIGAFRGRTTTVLAASTPGLVVTVDPWMTRDRTLPTDMGPRGWDGVRADFAANIAPYGEKVIHVTDGRDPRVSAHAPYEFIFIDGEHEVPGPAEDVRLYGPLLAAGGQLAGHDWWHKGVKAGVLHTYPLSQLTFPAGSIWAVKRGKA